MKALKVAGNWLLFALIIAAVFYLVTHPPVFPKMPGYLAVIFGFAIAFVWVEKLKWGKHKPLNCVPCMSGWFTMIIALLFHVPFWYFYLPLGVVVGAVFSAVKMRWL